MKAAINARSRGWAGADLSSKAALLSEEHDDILVGARRLFDNYDVSHLAKRDRRWGVVATDGNVIAEAWIDAETQLPVYMPTWSTPWE